MAKPSVLVLHNKPLLPADHPDAESEHTIVGIADGMASILIQKNFHVTQLGLGADPTVLWSELKKRKPDVVFNLFEGNLDNTETESYVAGLLDWAGVPYTGSPLQALELARSKHTTKYLLKGAGLPTADFLVVNELPVPECDLEFPVIVKPAKQDGSIGLAHESVCTNQDQIEQRAHYLVETYGPPVLIEEYVPGREFNVALLELPDLEYLPPAEIIFPKDMPGAWSILTYQGKWDPESCDYEMSPPKFPADVSAATARKLGRLAMRAYRLLGCRDYARVDFRMTPGGKPYILEVNPNPEISAHAGFTGSLESAHVPHADLVVRLVLHALSRKNAPKPSFCPPRPNSTMQATTS